MISLHGRQLQFDPFARRFLSNNALIPMGELRAEGKDFYVSSVTGASGSSGKNPAEALSTIDAAVAKCTANKGDRIIVGEGHTETITAASAIDLDVAGISLIGLGRGSSMPQIVFNHADATVAVGADGVTIRNIRFTSSITAVTVGVNIEADVDYTLIEDCLFDVDATTTDEFNHAIRMVDGNIGTIIQRNTFHQGLGGAVAAIHMDADTSYTQILANYITGDYSTACIVGDTTLSTNLLIQGNLLVQGIGGNIGTEPAIELLTGTTGVIADNYIVCNLATKLAAIVGDTVFLFENYYNEDVTGTGGLIGAVSADD